MADNMNALWEKWDIHRSFIQEKNKLILFVSSTFTDTHIERNILLENILPRLQKVGRPYDVDVIFVDLRFGLRDKNTLDHMTWIACLREIKRCFKESSGMAFLSLQGDKYGYMPIPKFVGKKIFDDCLDKSDDCNVRSIAHEWYNLDENMIPPAYVLKVLLDRKDKIFCELVLPKLRETLSNISFDSEYEELLVDRSVSEWEAKVALNLSKSSAQPRMLWLHRKFVGAVKPDQDPKHHLFDAHEPTVKIKLDNYLEAMTSSLSQGNCICDFQLSVDSYYAKNECWKTYIEAFEDKAFNLLHKELNDVIDKKLMWDKDGEGLGLPGVILKEIIHHIQWANLKCSTFEGRNELLSKCIKKVYGDTDICNKVDNLVNYNGESKFIGICLAIVGVSGCGKTALMSKIAEIIRKEDIICGFDRPVIIRFCGTTGISSYGLSLIQNISYQIRYSYKDASPTVPSSDYDTAVAEFQFLLAKYAIILLIDGLDQLVDTNQARSKISFLVGVQPHANTRIIVSCLPDEKDAATGDWKYCYLCDTRLKEANVPRVSVSALVNTAIAICDNESENVIYNACNQSEEVGTIMRNMLTRMNRSVTPEQFDFALKKMYEEPTALYLFLATHTMSHWKSFDSINNLRLEPTVTGLTNQIFDSLERDFGVSLTRTALGLITFAVAGISDNEMQDLLSLDDDVLKEVFQYSQLGIKRLPIHVWLRLRVALEHLIVERERGCLVWYHRQLKEIAATRYSSKKKQLHKLLGKYFADIVDYSVKRDRLITSQPLMILQDQAEYNINHSIWMKDVNINRRRCVESASHLISAGLLDEAATELCSLESVCARALIGEGFTVVGQLALLSADSTMHGILESNRIRIKSYFRWVRQYMTSIARDPAIEVIFTAGLQPGDSHVFLELRELFKKPTNLIDGGQYVNNNSCIRSVILSKGIVSENLLGKLEGHSGNVIFVAWSPDNRKLASTSSDKTIRIWNSLTGSVLAILSGHEGNVNSVTWHPSGRQLASASSDCCILLWDIQTESIIHKIQSSNGSKIIGHEGMVFTVSWSADGKQLASGSDDGTVIFWNMETYDIIKKYCIHQRKTITTVTWSPDDIYLACTTCNTNITWTPDDNYLSSPSSNTNIYIYNTKISGESIALQGHSKGVLSVAWSYDFRRIASASKDYTVRIWLVMHKEQWKYTYSLNHDSNVTSLSWNPTSTHLVSGTWMSDVCIWLVPIDQRKGQLLRKLKGHTNFVRDVKWSFDGATIASAGYDFTVRLWDVTSISAMSISEINPDNSVVNHVKYSPDGSYVASACENHLVNIWNCKLNAISAILKGHESPVIRVAWRFDGVILASLSLDETVICWDVNSNAVITTINNCISLSTGIAYKLSEMLLQQSTKSSRMFRVSDYENNDGMYAIHDNDKFIRGIVSGVSRMEQQRGKYPKLLAADAIGDAIVYVWDYRWGSVSCPKLGRTYYFCGVEWSSDGEDMAVASLDFSIVIWNISSPQIERALLRGHRSWITSISWIDINQKLLSSSYDTTLRIWDVTSAVCLRELSDHTAAVIFAAWNSHRSCVASASDDTTIKIWNTSTENSPHTLEGHSSMISGVAWSRDGLMLASASWDKTIRIWDPLNDYCCLHVLRHRNIVCYLEWNPHQPQLVTCCWSNVIYIWNLSDESRTCSDPLITAIERQGFITSIAWDPTGNGFASAFDDGCFCLWDGITPNGNNIPRTENTTKGNIRFYSQLYHHRQLGV